MKNYKKGFTLIELLVVIAIIGILSTVAMVGLNGARVKANVAAYKSEVASAQPSLINTCDGVGTPANNTTMITAAGANTTRHQNATVITACDANGDFNLSILPVAGAAGTCTNATVTPTAITFLPAGNC